MGDPAAVSRLPSPASHDVHERPARHRTQVPGAPRARAHGARPRAACHNCVARNSLSKKKKKKDLRARLAADPPRPYLPIACRGPCPELPVWPDPAVPGPPVMGSAMEKEAAGPRLHLRPGTRTGRYTPVRRARGGTPRGRGRGSGVDGRDGPARSGAGGMDGPVHSLRLGGWMGARMVRWVDGWISTARIGGWGRARTTTTTTNSTSPPFRSVREEGAVSSPLRRAPTTSGLCSVVA